MTSSVVFLYPQPGTLARWSCTRQPKKYPWAGEMVVQRLKTKFQKAASSTSHCKYVPWMHFYDFCLSHVCTDLWHRPAICVSTSVLVMCVSFTATWAGKNKDLKRLFKIAAEVSTDSLALRHLSAGKVAVSLSLRLASALRGFRTRSWQCPGPHIGRLLTCVCLHQLDTC